MEIIQALMKIKPGASWYMTDSSYSGLVWTDIDQTKPTEQEILDYIDANSYKEVRKKAYPALAELADAIYWNEKGDSTKLASYIAACDAVKVAHPKPE